MVQKKRDWNRISRSIERNMQRNVHENDATRGKYSAVNSRNRQTKYGADYQDPLGEAASATGYIVDRQKKYVDRIVNRYLGNRNYKYKTYKEAKAAVTIKDPKSGKVISSAENQIEPVRDKDYNIIGYNIATKRESGLLSLISGGAGKAFEAANAYSKVNRAKEMAKLMTRMRKANTVRKAANVTKAFEKSTGINIANEIVRPKPIASIPVGRTSGSVSAKIKLSPPRIRVSTNKQSPLVRAYEANKSGARDVKPFVKPSEDMVKVKLRDGNGKTQDVYIDRDKVTEFYARQYREHRQLAMEKNAEYYDITSPDRAANSTIQQRFRHIDNKYAAEKASRAAAAKAAYEKSFKGRVANAWNNTKQAVSNVWDKGKAYLAKRKAERAAAKAEAQATNQATTEATTSQAKPGFFARRRVARGAKREQNLAKQSKVAENEGRLGRFWRGKPKYDAEGKYTGRSRISAKNALKYGLGVSIPLGMAVRGINRHIDESPSYTPKSGINQQSESQQVKQIAEAPNAVQDTTSAPRDTTMNVVPQDTTAAVRDTVINHTAQPQETSNNNSSVAASDNNSNRQTNIARPAANNNSNRQTNIARPAANNNNNNVTARNARAAARQNRKNSRMRSNYNSARRLKAALQFTPIDNDRLEYIDDVEYRKALARRILHDSYITEDPEEDRKIAYDISPEVKMEEDAERKRIFDQLATEHEKDMRENYNSEDITKYRIGGRIYKRR